MCISDGGVNDAQDMNEAKEHVRNKPRNQEHFTDATKT